jgi:hypothetical protein
MVLPHIPLSEWTEAHLQRLVELGIQENDLLEYKRDMYGGGDEETREMLRDIAAMANHRVKSVVSCKSGRHGSGHLLSKGLVR